MFVKNWGSLQIFMERMRVFGDFVFKCGIYEFMGKDLSGSVTEM